MSEPSAVPHRIPVEVHFTPPAEDLLAGAAVLVFDVLRATTVQAALIGGGAAAIHPVADFGAGAALAAALPGAKLIGERGALPPPEADFGNSPTEFAAMDVRGWTVVHATGNGTGALARAAEASFCAAACLRNLGAATEAVRAHAERTGAPIHLVCAGDRGGRTPSLEDGFAAALALDALERARGGAAAFERGGGAELAAMMDAAGSGGAPDVDRVMRASPHAARLRELGFEADLAFASRIDAASAVPVLERDGAGRPVLRALNRRRDRASGFRGG